MRSLLFMKNKKMPWIYVENAVKYQKPFIIWPMSENDQPISSQPNAQLRSMDIIRVDKSIHQKLILTRSFMSWNIRRWKKYKMTEKRMVHLNQSEWAYYYQQKETEYKIWKKNLFWIFWIHQSNLRACWMVEWNKIVYNTYIEISKKCCINIYFWIQIQLIYET